MSPETYAWLPVAHVFGIVLWIGSLLTCIALLHVHARAEERDRLALTKTEKRIAMGADMGATLAIAAGLVMAFNGKYAAINAFGTGAWLHVKLTAVVLGILSTHGMVRARIKRFSKGDFKPVPSWLPTLLLAAVAVAIALGANQTLLRK